MPTYNSKDGPEAIWTLLGFMVAGALVGLAVQFNLVDPEQVDAATLILATAIGGALGQGFRWFSGKFILKTPTEKQEVRDVVSDHLPPPEATPRDLVEPPPAP